MLFNWNIFFFVNWALSFSHFEFSQEVITISRQKFTIANPLQMVLYKIITAVTPKMFMTANADLIHCLQESGTELMKLYTLTPVQKIR